MLLCLVLMSILLNRRKRTMFMIVRCSNVLKIGLFLKRKVVLIRVSGLMLTMMILFRRFSFTVQ